MDLTFEMPVLDVEGAEAGWLDRVLVDPATREVTHVVVRSPRVSEEVLLSLDLVQGSAEGRLLLHLTGADLENLPRYYEGRTISPPAGRVDVGVVRQPPEQRALLEEALGVPAGAIELGPETRVVTTDGVEGRLAGVRTEQYVNRLSAVCVAGLRDPALVVPEAWVGALRPGVVALSAPSDALDRLIGAPSAQFVQLSTAEPHEVAEREAEPE